MPVAGLNGIEIGYRVHGSGPPVLMLMGTGSPGRVWELHQVPALVAAGRQVITMDARGIPPSTEPQAMTVDDLVADAAALLEHLGCGPAAVVGTSLGARVTQELALARPDLVAAAVCLAAHGRVDPVQRLLVAGERALHDKGITLPPEYHAAVTALLNLSPRTYRDPAAVRDWTDLFAFSGSTVGKGARAQLELADFADRLPAYRRIAVPLLAVAFADDRIIDPELTREVADAVPGARYVEIAGCGHYGYLERPAEVNRVVLDFLDEVE